MKRSLTPVVALALLLAPLALAQPLADRLPASTMVYVGWSPNASLQNTAMAKMLADERVMGPWRRLFRDLLSDVHDAGAAELFQHVPALLKEAAQCEGCFALLELKPGDRNRLSPQSVLMIDLGARKKTFEQHFQPLHDLIRQRVGDRLQMMKLENSWVWFQPDRVGRPVVTWGFVGDVFVMFFGESAGDFIPKLVQGQFDNPLKTAPAFVDSVGRIPGESVFTTYLDVQASLTLLRGVVERAGTRDFQLIAVNWEKLLEGLGLANIKGLAEKTTVEDRQFVTRTLVRLEGPPAGLLALFAQPAVDEAMMKAIPADSMAAAAFRLDLAKFYDQLKSATITVAGDDARQTFNELEQAAQGMGLPLNEFLAALGDQWAIYNAQSHGGNAFTGWTLVASLRDVEKFRKSADVLRGMLANVVDNNRPDGAKLRQIDVDGVMVEFFELSRWGAPFAPAWAIVDDKLIVALYPQHVEDAIAQIKSGGKSLLDNPDYVAARQRTGGEGPVLYVSGPRIVDNLYPVALVVVSIVNSFGGWNGDEGPATTADLLPSMQRLIRHVGHDAISIKATPDGLLKTRTVANPLLSPVAWVDSPVVALAVLIPTISGIEQQQPPPPPDIPEP